jgi:hypothetical protein
MAKTENRLPDMGRKRDVGVARVPRQTTKESSGETSRKIAVARVPQNVEPTRRVPDYRKPAEPVFVDDTGRRRRLLTWVAFGLALLGLVLVALLWFSQTGVWVSPGAEPRCEAVTAAGCVPAEPVGS